MPTHRTYFVDSTVDNGINGFYCYCFGDLVQLERRFFTDYAKADAYGTEWVKY